MGRLAAGDLRFSGCCPAKQPVPPADGPELAVYLKFEHQPSETAMDEMEREVVSILEPVGLQLQWRLLDAAYISENFDELAVMRFTGQCRAFPLVRNGEAALGESVMGEGKGGELYEREKCYTPTPTPGFRQRGGMERLATGIASSGGAMRARGFQTKYLRLIATLADFHARCGRGRRLWTCPSARRFYGCW